MRTSMLDNLPDPFVVIGVPADVWDAEARSMFAEVWSISVLADVVIEALTDVMTGVGVNVEIMVLVATAAIDLEYTMGVACDDDVAVWDVTTIGVATDIGIDVLAGVDVKGLTAVTTALGFALSSPWEESTPFR